MCPLSIKYEMVYFYQCSIHFDTKTCIMFVHCNIYIIFRFKHVLCLVQYFMQFYRTSIKSLLSRTLLTRFCINIIVLVPKDGAQTCCCIQSHLSNLWGLVLTCFVCPAQNKPVSIEPLSQEIVTFDQAIPLSREKRHLIACQTRSDPT